MGEGYQGVAQLRRVHEGMRACARAGSLAWSLRQLRAQQRPGECHSVVSDGATVQGRSLPPASSSCSTGPMHATLYGLSGHTAGAIRSAAEGATHQHLLVHAWGALSPSHPRTCTGSWPLTSGAAPWVSPAAACARPAASHRVTLCRSTAMGWWSGCACFGEWGGEERRRRAQPFALCSEHMSGLRGHAGAWC